MANIQIYYWWFIFLYLLAAWVFGIGIASMWDGVASASRRRWRSKGYTERVKYPVIFLCSLGWPIVALCIIWEYYSYDYS